MKQDVKHRAFDVVAQSTAAVTQQGISCMIEAGMTGRHAAIFVAIGGVTGSLQVLASLIGREGHTHSAQGVNDDTILFAALLTAYSTQNKKCDKSDHVAIDTAYSPESFFQAMESFEKLTGRKADDVINSMLAKHVREINAMGVSMADDLLRAVCANHKPA